MATQLVIIDGEWPVFDPSDRAHFTPGSEKYIEAERLPPQWLSLVGKNVCADRVTVGTIADLLEELPPYVSEEWRKLYANNESDEGQRALDEFEEAHSIRWYGEGYYLYNGEIDCESEEDEKDGEAGGFKLEMATPSQLANEQERQRQRQEIARRMAEPIKGCGEIHVQPQLDVGQTGQMDLFNPIMEA